MELAEVIVFEPSGSKVKKSWSISSRVHCSFRLIIARRNSFGEIMPPPLRSHSLNKSITLGHVGREHPDEPRQSVERHLAHRAVMWDMVRVAAAAVKASCNVCLARAHRAHGQQSRAQRQ